MIKAQDLRIGNLLFDNKDQLSKVEKLESDIEECGIYAVDNATTYLPVKGIPLTEEILLKVGFEKYNDWFDYRLGKFWLKYITDDTNWQIECGQIIIDVLYLHQLQNLYFALTGQELNTSGLI